MDRVHTVSPFSARTNAILVILGLYLIQGALAYLTKEQSELTLDYAVPSLIILIGYLIYMEKYIGDYMKRTVDDISDALGQKVDMHHYMSLIFDNRIRAGTGAVLSAILFLAWPFLFAGHLWFSSPLVQQYIVVLALVFIFITGEALAGATTVLFCVYKISRGAYDIDIFDKKQVGSLMKLGNWCILCSLFGAIASGLSFPAFFFAPWKGQVPLISFVGKFGILVAIPLLMLLFVIPLFGFHRELVAAKNLRMLPLYENHVRPLYLKVKDHSYSDLHLHVTREEMAALSVADTLSRLINEVPDWPWDPAFFQTFMVSIIATIVSYVIINFA